MRHSGGKRTAAALLVGAAAVGPVRGADPQLKWTPVDAGPVACARAFGEPDRSGALHLDMCPELEASRGVSFTYDGFATPLGEFAVRGAVAQTATTETLNVDRMMLNTGLNFAQDNTSLTLGFTDRVLDGRLALATDLAWSQDSSIARGPGTMQARQRDGFARWHKLEAKLVDTPEAQWSLTADYGAVGDDYVANQAGRPRSAVMSPGERWAMASALKAFGTKVSASADRYTGQYGNRETERAKLSYDGVTIALASKRTAHLTGRKEVASATLELEPGGWLPAFVEEDGNLAALVPELASVTLSEGESETLGSPAQPLAGIEALANWNGMLGDTMAIYWREAKADGANLSQFLDVSHTVRWRGWRVGAGAMLMDFASAAANGSSDDTLSGSLLLAYEVTDGPQFTFRVGHDRDTFEMADESFASQRVASNISLALDLSPMIRKELDRPGLHLTFEYRKKLDETVDLLALSDFEIEAFAAETEREGLLISFGGRL